MALTCRQSSPVSELFLLSLLLTLIFLRLPRVFPAGILLELEPGSGGVTWVDPSRIFVTSL